MKYKVLGCLVLLAMIATFSESVHAETHLTITSEHSEYFSTRAFSTTLKVENADAIAGFQFKLTYDATKYQINSVNKHHFNIVYNTDTAGEIIVTLASASSPIHGTQDLMTVNVTVLTDSNIGELSPLFVMDPTYHQEFIHEDVSGNLIEVAASVTLGHSQRRLLGDVNLDDQITVMDVLMMQRHLAEIQVLEGLALEAADLSGNQDLTLLDILHVQEYVAGLENNVIPSP